MTTERIVPFRARDGFEANLVNVRGQSPPEKGPVQRLMEDVVKRSGLEATLKKDEGEEGDDPMANVNELISSGLETKALWIGDAELDAQPELVRTMSVAPPRGEGRVRLLEIPGVDLQACGGTHVRNTMEIGNIAVMKIRSEGKRNKRVTLVLP